MRIHRILSSTIKLTPVQGHVRPASYAAEEGRTEPRIVRERRYLDNREVEIVLLDSIPSQANRMEAALYALRETLGLPDIRVRFPDGTVFGQWELPHRIYDAIIRDSHLGGKPFFATEVGRAVAKGDPRALFNWAPNVLLFGGWNSHAQQEVGSLEAARVERAITAEVVGLEPKEVARTASRMDPTGIPGNAPLTPDYEREKEGLGGGRNVKKLSELGLGKVAPGFRHLDVSITDGRHLVLFTTLPWRRMGLPEEVQAVLQDLALLALARLYEEGLYLRSGTILLPAEEPVLTDPTTGEKVSLPPVKELEERVQRGLKALPDGYRWEPEPMELEPSQALQNAYEQQAELRRKAKGSGAA